VPKQCVLDPTWRAHPTCQVPKRCVLGPLTAVTKSVTAGILFQFPSTQGVNFRKKKNLSILKFWKADPRSYYIFTLNFIIKTVNIDVGLCVYIYIYIYINIYRVITHYKKKGISNVYIVHHFLLRHHLVTCHFCAMLTITIIIIY
jgi:hypothetical protein